MDDLRAKGLIVRADAGPEMGTGHLMRCLALAQAWKDHGGRVVFVTACSSEALLGRLRHEEFDVRRLDRPYPETGDWETTNAVLREHPQAWVVLDGYHFDQAYQRSVRESGHGLLVVDDMAHLKHYHADVLLNQNLHADQLHYSCEPDTTLLLGTRYVLLRREFLGRKDRRRDIPQVARRLLITMGGSDPGNHTLGVLQAIQNLEVPGLEAVVVVGAGNHHAHDLEAFAGRSCVPLRLVHDAPNMPELMAWADVAVSGAGSTTWELMLMGLPSLLLAVADNQSFSVRVLRNFPRMIQVCYPSDQASLTRSLRGLAKSKKMREAMSKNSRAFIDGSGAERVVAAVVSRTHLPSSEDCTETRQWA